MSSATIAVLGLGEAGGAIAADLAASGARVLGWDPALETSASAANGGERPVADPASAGGRELSAAGPRPGLAGVELAVGDREAVSGADLVLSVNSASVALAAAESAAPGLREGQVYADLNTGSPGLKRAVADAVAPSGAAFADVALMAPVPGRGIRTPALAARPGAPLFAASMAGFGMPVTVLHAEPGAAAARKLARSVFAKGMAAAVGEALAAGERLGCAEWLRRSIAGTLEEADAALLDRLVDGSRLHAARRVEEMAAAVAMLDELGVEPRVAAASEAWLRSLAGSQVPG